MPIPTVERNLVDEEAEEEEEKRPEIPKTKPMLKISKDMERSMEMVKAKEGGDK